MFGGINNNSKRFPKDTRDISQSSPRNKNSRFIKTNISRYDETTYSLSSEEESDESQRSIIIKPQKQKIRPDTIKPQTINNIELEAIKIENSELKLKNDILMKLSTLSESIVKNSNLMMDICNEQKFISSRLDKLEQESKNKSLNQNLSQSNNRFVSKNINNKPISISQELNDDDILPIGDDSSLSILSTENNSINIKLAVDDTLIVNKPVLLPKIEEKK